jgi:hypothetical protein
MDGGQQSIQDEHEEVSWSCDDLNQQSRLRSRSVG